MFAWPAHYTVTLFTRIVAVATINFAFFSALLLYEGRSYFFCARATCGYYSRAATIRCVAIVSRASPPSVDVGVGHDHASRKSADSARCLPIPTTCETLLLKLTGTRIGRKLFFLREPRRTSRRSREKELRSFTTVWIKLSLTSR